MHSLLLSVVTFAVMAAAPGAHQTGQASRPAPGATPPPAPAPAPRGATSGVAVPTDYVIGPDDVLGVVFWRDTDMSGDVTVRPDGMITLPLIRDVKAAGLTPEQLRELVQTQAKQYISDPNVTVIVRQINSRNVFITGSVLRPGSYPISGEMTVLQLIALAGGLGEFADSKNISVNRVTGGTKYFRFNYNDVAKGKKVEQNIVLKPGDTVLVP